VPREAILVDPGIGFGKTVEHNVSIFRSVEELRSLGQPILVGPSRKSFLGALTGKAADARTFATAAAVAAAVFRRVHVVRVHDVEEMVLVARVTEALRG
jgi:dihydropteroate synthase